MSKALIKGSGKHFIWRIIGSVLVIALGIIMIVFFGIGARFVVAPSLDYQEIELIQRIEEVWHYSVIIGTVFIVISIAELIRAITVYKTNIVVYEDSIKGRFMTGFFSTLQEISLSNNDIKEVSTKTEKVIVHTAHAKYICHTKKCDEIRDKIMELINDNS